VKTIQQTNRKVGLLFRKTRREKSSPPNPVSTLTKAPVTKVAVKIPVLPPDRNDLGKNPPRESPFLAKEMPDVRALTLTQATQIIAIVLGVTAFAYFARPLVLPVMMAWVASMALKPLVTWLRNRHLPAPLAAAFVVGVFGAALASGAYYLGRPAAVWIKSSPQTVPQLQQKFQNLIHPIAGLNLVSPTTTILGSNLSTNSANAKNPIANGDTANDHIITTVFNWTGTALAGTVETVALLFLLLASGDLFTQKLVHVMPTLRDKKRAVDLSHEIQQGISNYLFSVSIINIGLGLIVGTAFYFLGLPNPAMWGAVAAVANFIPYFGPVLGMIAVAVAGLLEFNTIGAGLAPAAAYLGVHLIEANLITPYALGRRFTLNPVVIFVFLIFCIWLWGIIGAFLAVPILVTLKVLCDRVPTLTPLGEFLAS